MGNRISFGEVIGTIVIWYFIISYIINIFKFIGCDFASPYKEEVIHLVGIILFPAAGITVWF